LPESARGINVSSNKQLKHLEPVANAVRSIVEGRTFSGMFIMAGPNGVGKSRMIFTLINEACGACIRSLYATTESLIDELRLGATVGTIVQIRNEYWNAPVLAVDEFTRGNMTDFAQAQLIDLIGYRFDRRSSMMTIVAFNTPATLIPYIESRFKSRDGRFFNVDGPDLRPYLGWSWQERDLVIS
jgi:DNA replication protein DnaC